VEFWDMRGLPAMERRWRKIDIKLREIRNSKSIIIPEAEDDDEEYDYNPYFIDA
jgi:hypothetical protein